MNISVIIPVYNGDRYLETAVSSVIDQPYNNINIIIVNDGSTDNTKEVCDKLEKNNINIKCIHKENGGVSSARNTGIEYALKNYNEKFFIAFLDADDMWNSNGITENINNYSDSDMLVFGSIQANAECSGFSAPLLYKYEEFENCTKHIWKFPESFCGKFFSSELFRKHGIRFDEQLKHNEDRIMQLQSIYFSNKITTLPILLFIRRNHPQSVSHNSFRTSPENLYLPMISGWLRSDDFIKNSAYGEGTLAGHVMAGIYLLDMAEYSARKSFFYGRKIIKKLPDHPNYDLLKNMRAKDVSAIQYSHKQYLFSHPLMYLIKNRISGIIFNFGKLIQSIPFINNKYESRKYKLKELPENP